MYDTPKTMLALEDEAIHHLQHVDVNTALRQLDSVFEALIQVPTKERRSDTEFTRRAKVELDILVHQINTLSTYVHSLCEHVGTPRLSGSMRKTLRFIPKAMAK
jgi:hypothetical protein